MVKGIQRQMVVVNISENETFETAYLVMRPNVSRKREDDMVAEANRLVDSLVGHKRKKKKKWGAASFFIGVLIGTAIGALLAIAVYLLLRF